MSILKSTNDNASSVEPGLVSLATLQEALDGLSSSKAMTPAGVKAVIDQLIGGAPELLDTLNELAAAINDDENFATTIQATLTSLQNQINTLSGTNLGALTQEIDDIETGAGLNSDGSYTAPTSSNYLGSATSLKDADSKLDAQIALNTAAISSLGSGNIANLQSEIDSVESSVGINSDGSYTAQSGNYIGSASSVRGEISALDTQVKTNADAIANMASSTAITSLQSEVDDIETAVGLNSDGSYSAHSGSNYMDSDTSVKGALSSLDTQIKTNSDAIATKAASSDVTSLQSTVSGHTSDISSLQSTVSGHTTDISGLQSEVDATQAGVGLASDGSYSAISGANYATSSSNLKAAVGQLDTQLKSTQDDLDTLEALVGGLGGNNQSEVDAIEASVGINSDGSYTAPSGTNYIDSATSVRDEIVKLDTQVKNRADSISTNASNISTNTTNIALKADSSTVSAISTELTTTQAAAGFNADGSYSAHSGSNYIDSATTTKSALGLLDAEIFQNAGDISNLTSTVSTLTSGSSSNASDIAALQSEVDATQAGAGLGTTGAYSAPGSSNYLSGATSLKDADNKLDAQIKTNADAIALKASSADLTSLTSTVSGHTSDIASNASDISTNAGNISTNTSNISTNTSNIALKADSSTVSAISTELTATQSSVGLNTDGTYSAHSGSNYIDGASSVKGAMTLLDTQIKDNADDISTNTSSISTNASDITSLETLADTHETALGLNTDGTYTAISSANYASSGNLKGAVAQLDTQAKSNADAIATEISNRQSADSTINSTISTLQGEVDDTQSGAGLGSDGSYTANSGMNYIAAATSLKDADEKLDAQIKTNADAIASNDSDIASINTSLASKASSASVSSLQTEVDGIETAVGLSSSGAYVAHSGSNYLDAATTVKGALTLLDTQAKSNADNISSNDTDISNLQTLADTHESSIGLNSDGSYTAISGNYAVSSVSLKAAVGQLDSQVKTNADAIALRATTSQLSTLQSEVDAIETAVGLASDGTFSSFSGQNYLNSATTIKGGMELLDAAIKVRQDNIDSEASTRASQDSVLSGKIDTVEASVGLQADGSLSITGTNYLNSSSTIVAALDTLDTNQKYLRDVQDNLRGTVGSGSTGLLGSWNSSYYVGSDTSLKAAIESLDAQVKSNADDITGLGGTDISNLQSELDDTQTAVGLDSNGDYVSRSGSNYLDSATNVVGEITALDTQVKTNADNIALKANSTTLSALDLRVTQLEIGDGGILLDHASDDAVEMDDTISQFQSKSGPFQISLASLVSSGTTDLVFFGSKGERDGDRHFAIHPISGDAIFAGKHS